MAVFVNHEASRTFAGFNDQFRLVQMCGVPLITKHEVHSARSVSGDFIVCGAGNQLGKGIRGRLVRKRAECDQQKERAGKPQSRFMAEAHWSRNSHYFRRERHH
jgi:hypothetical protein